MSQGAGFGDAWRVGKARTPRWAGPGAGAGRRAVARCERGAEGARGSAGWMFLCRTDAVWPRFAPKFWIEVHKVMNRKIVDPTTLYNFYKGSRVFFSTDLAGTSCQLWMPACSGKQEVLSVDQVFHQFPLKIWNANLHESCIPQQDGQLS
jgi:hypothetical protein